MSELVTMAAALAFPFLALLLVLWLAHLEETLPGAVKAARRDPAPAPILAIAVGPEPALVVQPDITPGVVVTDPVHQVAV